MKLITFSITNFRSITNAHKINLEDITVLLGKNNEGKSNIIKALSIGMNIISHIWKTYIKKKLLYNRRWVLLLEKRFSDFISKQKQRNRNNI